MRKKKLYAAMLMLGMANSVHALGLGELNIESSLFQPLHADIEIYGWDDVSLENLRASLASQNAFLRANIERPHFLRSLKMDVLRTANNDAIIRITSKRPVREPMLDVLIDVEWPGGHLQKQYTIFLDPPVTAATLAAETAPQPSAGASSAEGPAPAPSPKPVVTSAAVTQAIETQAPTAAASELTQPAVPGTYRVRSGDTLSRIADNFKKRMGVTRDQLMTAILDGNPRAFIAGNINGLMGGVELTIPEAATVAGRTPDVATAQVQEQHQAWRDRNKPPAPTEVAKAPEDTTGLRLVPTVQEPAAEAQPSADASTAQRELTVLEKELAETRRLLYEREAELDVMRSRMAVYDAELQDLKSQLNEVREVVVAKAPVVVEARPPVESTTRPTDIRTLLIALFAVLGGFGLFAFVYRRLTLRAQPVESARMTPLPLEISESLAALEESEDDDEAQEEDTPEPAVEKKLEIRENSHVDRNSPTEVREIMADPQPGAETADRMLVEADVLIQFGFLQRSRDLIDEALSHDPGNPQYRLKLMELSQAVDDKESFREHAELLRERITPQDTELWTSAAKITEALFPGDPLFSTSDYAPRDVAIGGEPTPGKEASWDPLTTQEIPKLDSGDDFQNLNEVLESPTGEKEAAKSHEWEFQPPPADSGERPATPDGTREFLLADEQLESFESSTDDLSTGERSTPQLRGQLDTSETRGAETPDRLNSTESLVTGNNPASDDGAADMGGTQKMPVVQPPKPQVSDPPGAVTGELDALGDVVPEPASGETGIYESRSGETQAFPSDTTDEATHTTRNWQTPEGGGETQSFATSDFDEVEHATRDWQVPEGAGGDTQSFNTGESESTTREWQVPDELHPPEGSGGDTQSFDTGESETAARAKTRAKPRKKRRKRKSR